MPPSAGHLGVSEVSESTDRPTSTTSPYLDLPAHLMANTWWLLAYVASFVVVIYFLGINPNEMLLFLAAQLPALAATTTVLSPNERLRWRVPWTWPTTAILTLAYTHRTASTYSIANEFVSLALIVLLLYWLVRGVQGSREEFHPASIPTFIAGMLSVWGATLQLVLLAMLVIKPFLLPVLTHSRLGTPLLATLTALRLTSPISWIPFGLLIPGLMLYAALRFRGDPYHSKDYDDVLAIKTSPIVTFALAVLRLPAWMCIVTFEFLVHFVKQLVLSFQTFGDRWVGRLLLILMALVVPTALMLLAHLSVLRAIRLIVGHLLLNGSNIADDLLIFLLVHLLVLLSFCLYILSVAPLGLLIIPVPAANVRREVRVFMNEHGWPAAKAVGQAFSLYGVAFLAIPMAAIFPGSFTLGIFSISYTAIVVVVVAYYYVVVRTSGQQHAS